VVNEKSIAQSKQCVKTLFFGSLTVRCETTSSPVFMTSFYFSNMYAVSRALVPRTVRMLPFLTYDSCIVFVFPVA
jgi:hypothetical protein